MFWLFTRRDRVTNLEKEIKVMAEEILAKIELVRSVVMDRIEGLEAHISELEAQVSAGAGKPEILAALGSLKAEVLGILPESTPEPETEPNPETEGVDVGEVEPVDDDIAE